MRSAASGLARVRAALAIEATCRVGEQGLQYLLQAHWQAVVLLEQHGGVGADQVFGIAGLMIVDGGGKRHQHAADTGGAQFGQGGRAGAAYHQICPGIGSGHVGNEGFDAGVDACLCIGRFGFGAQLSPH